MKTTLRQQLGNRGKTWLFFVLASALALPSVAAAQTTYVWDAGAAAGGTANPTAWDTSTLNWSSATQAWVNDPVNSTASFTTTGAGLVAIGVPIQAAGIQFSGTGNYTITGTTTNNLSLGAGGITDSSSVAQIITAPIALVAAQQWTNSGVGLLTVTGAISNGGNNLTISGSGTIALNGGLSGSGGLIMSGTGTLTLTGAATVSNTYSGGTTVNSGTLALTGAVANGVGIIAGVVNVNQGGTLTTSVTNAFGTVAGQKINTLNIVGGTVSSTAGNNDEGFGLVINLTGGATAGATLGGGQFTGGGSATQGTSAINSFPSATSATTLTNTISARYDLKDGSSFGSATPNILPITVQAGPTSTISGATVNGVDLNFTNTIFGADATTGIAINAPASGSAGIMQITSNASYTGGTTINAGTLVLNGGGGSSGTLRGPITINSAATLMIKVNNATGYGNGTDSSYILVNGGTLLNAAGSTDEGYGNNYVLENGGKIAPNSGGSGYFCVGNVASNTASFTYNSTTGLVTVTSSAASATYTGQQGTVVPGQAITMSNTGLTGSYIVTSVNYNPLNPSTAGTFTFFAGTGLSLTSAGGNVTANTIFTSLASSVTNTISARLCGRALVNSNTTAIFNVQQGTVPPAAGAGIGVDLNLTGSIFNTALPYTLIGGGSLQLSNLTSNMNQMNIAQGTILIGATSTGATATTSIFGTGSVYLGYYDFSNTTLDAAYRSFNTVGGSLLSNGAFSTPTPIIVGPTGTNVIGGNTDNTSVFSGSITMGGNATITQVANVVNNGLNFLSLTGAISSSATSGTQTIHFAGPGNMVVSGVIGNGSTGGTVAVNVTGGRTTFLSANTFTGPITITGGSLNVPSGTLPSSATVSVADGGAFNVINASTSTSPLTLSTLSVGTVNGATLGIGLNGANPTLSNVPISVSSLTAIGTTAIKVSNAGAQSTGEFPLLQYTTFNGLSSPTVGQISPFFQLAGLPTRTVATLDFSTAGLIQLDVISTDSIIWTGALSTAWDTGSAIGTGGTQNWKTKSVGAATNFVPGDVVTFDDSSTGAVTPGKVTIAATVLPGSVTFNNNSIAYTVSGAGGISGVTQLTINGSGSVTLQTANTYSGGTVLNSGLLNIGVSSAIGTGPLTITGGSINNTSGAALTLAANNVQNWNGNFTFVGSNALNLGTGAVTLGNNVTITASGSPANPLTVGGVISGAFGLTLNGTGSLTLGTNQAFTGPTVVNGGILQVNGTNSTTGGLASSGNLTINSGGTVYTGGTDNGLGGNGPAMVITINTGGILTSAPTFTTTNHLHALNLFGGTLAFNGTVTGSALTYGAYNLDAGATVGGATATATSIISAPNVALTQTGGTIFNVTTAATQTVPGVDLDVTGYFGQPTGITNTGLTLQGGGVMRLDGANTFTQATTITAGTLILGNGVATGSLATSSIALAGTLVFAPGTTPLTLAPSGGISGAGTIIQMGPGVTNLGGSNLFSGNVLVKGGTLNALAGSLASVTTASVTGGTLNALPGSLASLTTASVTGGNLVLSAGSINSAAAVSISDGAALTVINLGPSGSTVTLASLALGTSAGAKLNFGLNGLPSVAALTVTNPIVQNGTTTIAVTNAQAFQTATEYPLISYTGTLGSYVLAPSASGRTLSTLDFSTAGLVQLKVTSTGVIWTGAASTAWDSTSTNWSFNASPTQFITGDNVVFDDSSSGTAVTPGSVVISSNVQPASVLFNNHALAYTVTGTAAIADLSASAPTTLSVAGGGKVTLATANTYSGGTFLSSGQLNINNASAIGTGLLTISGGAISNTSGAPITLSTNNPQLWSGSFTFGGNSPLNMGAGGVALAANVALTALNPGGAAPSSITNAAWATGVATITIGSSPYQVGETVTVAGITGQIGYNGTYTITAVTATTFSYALATQPTGTLGFASANSTGLGNGLTLPGVIAGAGGLTIAGSGVVNLNAGNGFSGGLTLTGGLLNIGNVGALGSGTFTLQGGSFDNQTGGAITLPNAHVWNGNFTFIGTNSITAAVAALPVTLAGNSTITLNGGTATVDGTFPNGTLFIGTGATVGGSTLLINDNGSNYSLGVSGTGTMNLLIGGSTFGGGLTIGSTTGTATVVLGNNGTVGDENVASVGTGTITLNSGGKLWAQPGSTGNLYTFNNNFVFNGGVFQGEDGVQHLAGSTIVVGALGGTVEATWNGKDVYLDGLVSGSGPLLLTHGSTGGSNPAIHFTNGGNTYSGIVSVSGSGSGITLAIDQTNALQFATINTNPGTAGIVLVNNGGGATIGALTGTAGTVEPVATAGTYTLTFGGSTLANTNTYGGTLINNTGILAVTMQAASNQTQVLTGVNTYTGATTVNSGTLQIGNGVTAGSISATSQVTINGGNLVFYNYAGLAATQVAINGGNLVFNLPANSPATLAPASGITGGSGAIIQMGPGTVNLGGTGSFSGNIQVNGGTLGLVAGAVGTSVNVAVADGATLSVGTSSSTFTVNTLSLGTSTGASLTLGLSGTVVPLSVTATNGFTRAGTNMILVSSALAVGEFSLIGYTGTQITAANSDLTLGALPGRGSTGNLDYSLYNAGTQTGTIRLNVTSVGAIVWTGVVSGGVWNTGTAFGTGGIFNWKFNGAATNFFTGDAVIFDDSAAAVAAAPAGTVNILTVQPSSVTFNNLNLAYTINGTGAIADGATPTPVTIKGGGTVNMNTANTYSGGTNLVSGQLNIGNAAAIGTGPFTISAGATIDNSSGAAITLGNVQNWNGNFTFKGSNSLTLSTPTITLGGNVVLTLNGTPIGNTGAGAFPNGTLFTSATISDNGNNYSVTVSGTGVWNMNTNAATYTGGTTINATIVFGNGATATPANNPLGSGPITINQGGLLWVQPQGGSNTVNATTWGNNFVFNGGTFIGQDGGEHIGTSTNTITINGPNTSSIGGVYNNKPVYIDGVLQGSGPLLIGVAGNGAYVHITNPNNTYNGTLSVAGPVALALDASTALQFASINTSPSVGAGGIVLINTNPGAIIAGLNGTSGTVEPAAALPTNNPGGNVGAVSLTINMSGANVFGGVVTDNAVVNTLTLNVNGTGSLTLSGNNAYSGGTNLNGGQLNINSATAIGTGTLAIATGLTIDNTSGSPITLTTNNSINWNAPSGGGATTFTFGGSNALNMGTGSAATMNSNLIATINGSYATALTVGGITDNGSNFSLTKNGPGALILGGATYGGSTTISAGTLQFNSTPVIGGSGASITVATGAVVAFGYAFLQSDLALVTSSSTGAVALAAANSNNLDFSAATGASLPSVTLGAAGAATFSGTLTPANSIYRLGGGGGVLTVATSLPNVNGTTQLIVNGNGTATPESSVVGGVPTGAVALTLPSTYSGGTTILDGTLNVNNTTGSGTGSGGVNVSGGTLGGIGSIAGAVTVNSGAIRGGVADGTNNWSTLNIANNVTINGASSNAPAIVTEVNRTGPGNLASSLISLATSSTAILNLNAGSGKLINLNILDTNGTLAPTETYTFNVAQAYQATPGSPTTTNFQLNSAPLSAGAVVDHQSSANGYFAVSIQNNPLYVAAMPVWSLAVDPTGSYLQLTETPNHWIGAASSLWTVASNWSANAVPGAGQQALFDQSRATVNGNTTISLNGITQPIGYITFDSVSSAAYTLGSLAGDAFSVSAGGAITVTSTVTTAQTINAAIGSLGAMSIVNNGTGGLTFNGAISLGGTITASGSGATTLGGIISSTGAFGMVMTGTGTLYLTGVNTFSGGTTITSGTLNINSDSALGAVSGPVNLNHGTLQFAVGSGVTLNGSRNIVLGGGAFDTNGGNDAISGIISGSSSANSNLIKNGAGDLALTNVNTYAGSTIVNVGGLVVGSTGSLGSGPLLVNNTNPAPSSTDVYLYNTAGQTVGNLSSNLTGAASGNTAGIFLGTGVTFTVVQTSPGSFQGTIFGSGNLVLGSSSTSTLTLSGNSTYAGSTTINGGTIQLGVANALPATTSLTLGSGGTLNLNNNNQTIAALNNSAGNINTGTGVGGILTVGNTAGGTVTYNGVISGTGGLTWGIVNTNVANPTPSTLLLTNTSTNTGPMTINSGKLSIGTAYALSGGVAPVLPYSAAATYPGAFTLGPTATLLTNGFNLTIGSLGGGGPIGGNINLGNNSSSTLYIVQSLVQSASTGYAGVISGTGNVYIVNGVNLAVYGNWTLTGGVTHDVTTLGANHNDSPQSYLPFATSGSAVATQGIEFAGFTDQVSTIYGGSAADNNGKGTFVDATGDAGKLVLSYYAASVANGGPANGSGGTQNFSGFFANDVGLIFDAGYFGNAQQLTLSGPNNTTGPLTIGFTNQTTPQNGAATGAQSGVMNQIIISATSSFGAVTVGNIAVSNLINNLTVQPTGNLTATSVTIGDAFPGSTGNNSVTVGGTLTAPNINIGNTNIYGVNNVLTILSTGTVKASGAITIGNDFATTTGTLGTLNVNGALGTTSAPVTSLSVQAGGVLTGYGTINTATNPINVTNGTIRGGFDDGVNQLGTLSIASSSSTTAKAVLTIQGSGSSGLGQTGALMTEVLATSSTAATNSKINITGANNALSLNTTSGGGSGQINIVLYDPTASLTPGGPGGATYTFVLATVATAGRIQLGGTNQSAGMLIDNGATLGAGSGAMGNADLYIVGASQTYMNSVTTWSLSVDTTGRQLMLSVTSATPEPEHILLMCVGVLLAGFAIRRRWQQRALSRSEIRVA